VTNRLSYGTAFCWKVKMVLGIGSIANWITNKQQVQFPISINISPFLSVQGLQEDTVSLKGMSLN
jgi:hypothetical protein